MFFSPHQLPLVDPVHEGERLVLVLVRLLLRLVQYGVAQPGRVSELLHLLWVHQQEVRGRRSRVLPSGEDSVERAQESVGGVGEGERKVAAETFARLVAAGGVLVIPYFRVAHF